MKVYGVFYTPDFNQQLYDAFETEALAYAFVSAKWTAEYREYYEVEVLPIKVKNSVDTQ